MSNESIYVSAPGKIILFGEHAVVYGKTAVAGTINLRIHVSLHQSTERKIRFAIPKFGVEKTWTFDDFPDLNDFGRDRFPPSIDDFNLWAKKTSVLMDQDSKIEKALSVFWYLLLGVYGQKCSDQRPLNPNLPDNELNRITADLLAVNLTVKSDLSACVGLGSSGAYCVCISTALLQSFGIISTPSIAVGTKGDLTWEAQDLEKIKTWSSAAESIIHNGSSGLDVTMTMLGGVARYKKGGPITILQHVPELKVILVNSKVERNTGDMVKLARQRREKSPETVDDIYDSIDSISHQAVDFLSKPGNPDFYNFLNDLSKQCNRHLNDLGVGHQTLDQICTLLANFGINAKITGAGGGGCVFGFMKPDIDPTVLNTMEAELSQQGYEVQYPSLGGSGVLGHAAEPSLSNSP
ncbi:hypothetical protein L596_024706 [Steinernema carpocapsae]|uniref:Mevalonate kinase n=1 Tax=Steinernema carpocapsae TaxID=34508 RepID=A0A4U5M5N3_STECR|nr:hypothetical protein L596_024706 [Steinernema carpocapsae]